MTAIHQQKREGQRQILEDLAAYYRGLPRDELEKPTLALARITALRLSLRDLRDWQDSIRDAMSRT